MRKHIIRFGIFVFALVLTTCAGAAWQTPIRIASRVRVKAESLTMADLLPANVPGQIRAQARRIELGAAPLPGSRRRLSRAAIKALLGRKMSAKLILPANVLVERDSRELSREEVLAAIRKTLTRRGFDNVGTLTPEDVQFGVPVRVTTRRPGLRVIGMHIDPALRLAVFRLWTTSESDVRPFDVTLRPVGGLKVWLESVTGEGRSAHGQAPTVRTRILPVAGAGIIWPARRQRPKPLVLPWQTASLLLISGTMEIHTTAEPLERGYLGQVIRVRVHKTRRVFRATVVAPDCLEAKF